MRENPVREKSYAFALVTIGLYREMVDRHEFVLSRQMVRAGTSIGANVEEAQAAQTHREFVAKMSIASKEARECVYWLRLLRDSGLVDPARADPALADARSLVRLLTAIVKSAQKAGDWRRTAPDH